jgi:hypothetical protein
MAKPVFNPQDIIPLFDRYLSERRLAFSGVAIGGAALSVLGIVERTTRDVDILEPAIPGDVLDAARAFAAKHGLAEDWLNVGPASLVQHLPDGWRRRLQPLYSGKSLVLSTLGRIDLIRSKLWATCDRMRDVEDLVALNPTDDEVHLAADWVKPLDANPGWPAHVDTMAAALKKRLGRG